MVGFSTIEGSEMLISSLLHRVITVLMPKRLDGTIMLVVATRIWSLILNDTLVFARRVELRVLIIRTMVIVGIVIIRRFLLIPPLHIVMVVVVTPLLKASSRQDRLGNVLQISMLLSKELIW